MKQMYFHCNSIGPFLFKFPTYPPFIQCSDILYLDVLGCFESFAMDHMVISFIISDSLVSLP
jgi:hypothetical protein